MTERYIDDRGRARVDSESARRIEQEHGEHLKDVLAGYASQALFTRMGLGGLAEMLGVPYQTLNRWLTTYRINYPHIISDEGIEGRRDGLRKKVGHEIEANGKTMLLTEWADRLGCKPSTVANRIARGWPEHLAVTIPIGGRYRPRANNLPARHKWSRT